MSHWGNADYVIHVEQHVGALLKVSYSQRNDVVNDDLTLNWSIGHSEITAFISGYYSIPKLPPFF